MSNRQQQNKYDFRESCDPRSPVNDEPAYTSYVMTEGGWRRLTDREFRERHAPESPIFIDLVSENDEPYRERHEHRRPFIAPIFIDLVSDDEADIEDDAGVAEAQAEEVESEAVTEPMTAESEAEAEDDGGVPEAELIEWDWDCIRCYCKNNNELDEVKKFRRLQ